MPTTTSKLLHHMTQLPLTNVGSSEDIDDLEKVDPRDDRILRRILRRWDPVFTVSLPFSGEISAGKNTYVYDAHTYHTKVPPQGIARLVDYYTEPGDVILDPFCGSGMTGVAALELGRSAVLSDLSPAAAFIAENLNSPIDHEEYLIAVRSLLDHARPLERELYGTHCRKCGQPSDALYMVWSYGLNCSKCGKEFVLWDVARDERPSVRESKIKREFDCPHCGSHLAKRNLKRTKRHPVQIGYQCCGRGLKEETATPTEQDLKILRDIDHADIPCTLWYPRDPFPDGINTRQPRAAGIDTIDKAYTKRALYAMAYLWDAASRWPEPAIRKKLLFTLTSLYQRVTVFSEFRFWGGSSNTANYNVPHIMNEQNVFKTFARKANTISWYFREAPRVRRSFHVSVRSAGKLDHLPDKSIDYVFTDPPFGGNINYSEMNLLWESWLKNRTDVAEEAIVNSVQRKGVDEYRELLRKAFGEAHRVLKKDGWMTVVFHNSSQKVWHALQSAVAEAGFLVLGTQTFDKQHGTFKMFVSDNAVGYDLVLHCRKQEDFKSAVSSKSPMQVVSEEQVVRFIKSQLTRCSVYSVRYLHVKRADEFDSRKLYSEWLSSALSTGIISVDFESFRSLVDKVKFQLTDGD